MCVAYRLNTSRSRRLCALGNGCLAAGLILFQLVHPAGALGRDFAHAAAGFLVGISMALNLFGMHAVCHRNEIRN
jgi:hypothetical protein